MPYGREKDPGSPQPNCGSSRTPSGGPKVDKMVDDFFDKYLKGKK